ncbi:MAG: NADH-quinone oxidoreductase subunit NuoG [Solirubrobacteraceae bacterium]
MPRPVVNMVTLTIDGREVRAPEGAMLVDGAKHGDIEIPYFCYEPKLGPPVGACRMCLVEIEGIPKLQTACSTPVKDGMVVHTTTDRVREAQEAVVEFLLLNHPLDCPVCDKGGECPLQDISYGWGGGHSRFIEPKRHFEKPLALSPLIAIDRERCILCYRCVRFSQDVAEDYQLILHERGYHTYVGTFDGHPYVAPFSGNIIELCPVGALTSRPYRFRARPWDIESAGSVCTLCPAQCNTTLTVRDERVLRVRCRNERGNPAVDDGWLCDKGRFAYQAFHVSERITEPLVRDGDLLRAVPWDRALEAAAAITRHAGRAGALVGGQSTNEEAFLLARLFREGLGSGDIDSRAGGALPLELERALAAPALTATVEDLEFAHAVLLVDCDPIDDAPVLDLRIRKGARLNGVKVAIATSRPSALDPRAQHALRHAPGAGEAFLAALDSALGGPGEVGARARAAGLDPEAVTRLADDLRSGGDDVVVLYGERLLAGPRGTSAAQALLNVAHRLGIDAGRDGAGLIELPAGGNARGAREAGALPAAGPGLSEPPGPGRDAAAIARAARDGEITALWLLRADPLRDRPDRALWSAALARAGLVIAHGSVMTETIREHATVVFPAESYAEKEGTLTHPDGRLQRLRPAIGRPGDVRAEWRVIADVAARAGLDLGVANAREATERLVGAVPFYAGITPEEIGGRGVRWPEREAAAAAPAGASAPFELAEPPVTASPNGALRLGTFRSIWASPEVEVSPALKFLARGAQAELSPADAERLGVAPGEIVEVGSAEASVRASVALRASVPAGSVFLETGLAEGSAGALGADPDGVLVEVRPA